MNPLHYAVVVGVNRYPEIGHLNSPVGDAEQFAAWLRKPDGGGVEAPNLTLITVPDTAVPDGTPRAQARPKKGEIHSALHEHAKQAKEHVEAHPGDWEKTRLYVYVSGHGLAPGAVEAALLLADAAPDWFGENFPCGAFKRFYEESQHFHEVVFLADCCRFRIDDAPLALPPWTKNPGNRGKVLKMAGFATLFGDPAFEPPEEKALPPDEKRSYFTKALLEGLEGAAVDAGTGCIDSNSLAKYVKPRVRKLTAWDTVRDRPRTPQDPEFEADPADPIVFRRLTAAEVAELRRRTLRIRFATPFDGDVFLVSGRLKPLARHTVNGGVWEVAVDGPGLYRVHPAAGDAPAPPDAPNPFRDDGFVDVQEVTDVEL